MKIKLEIDISGFFCNQWPILELYYDKKQIFNDFVESNRYLCFELECHQSESLISFRHVGKRFGENDVWDTDASGADRYLQISDIKFDDVSVGQEILSKLWFETEWTALQKQTQDNRFIDQYSRFLSNGNMNFNGKIDLAFELPIYNWLIINKYKTNFAEARSYFSQYQESWHYEKDLEIIKEIKELMNFV